MGQATGSGFDVEDYGDLLFDVALELHRLGWRRDHPLMIKFLEWADVRSFGQLDRQQLQLLLMRLRGWQTPENPEQAKQISHLQWQFETLLCVVHAMFVQRWNQFPNERQSLTQYKDLLDRLKTYKHPRIQ